MKKCAICKHDILTFQSYEANAASVVHMACAMGRVPASQPSAHLSHAATSQFGDERRKVRRFLRSDEGMVFDE